MVPTLIKVKNGGYGVNSASVEVADLECDVCHTPQRVLCIDTSGAEYATLLICHNCFWEILSGKDPAL